MTLQILKELALKTDIDWELGQVDFESQIRVMIRECERKSKVITLPVFMLPGAHFLGDLAMLLAQVKCSGCEAKCCKKASGAEDKEGIGITQTDEDLLIKMSLGKHVKGSGDTTHLEYPCPLLLNNLCTVYPNRPTVCILFPFQTGGFTGEGQRMLAVSSDCPEARRIAKEVYLKAWEVRKTLQREEIFLKK